MSNPRKNPLKIRGRSKKEFSRVTALLRSQIKALEIRVAALEQPKPKRRRKKKVTSEPPKTPESSLKE